MNTKSTGPDPEADDYFEQIRATRWHRRDLLNIEQALAPPVSRRGRAIYYAVVPFVVLAMILSNVWLSLLF
jgi:hypothetical protein